MLNAQYIIYVAIYIYSTAIYRISYRYRPIAISAALYQSVIGILAKSCIGVPLVHTNEVAVF